MLKRKIEDTLLRWKNNAEHKPLVIMGIRQCGKTFIAQHFAAAHYKSVVYINFIKQPERIGAFAGSKAVDDILLNLSAQIAGVTFLSGETCFIFDEIQECPEARTALKFFKEDGAFREPCPQRVQPGTDVIIRNHVKTSLRTKYQKNDMTFAHVIIFS